MRDRGEFFVVNGGGEPDEEKKHGLYGIDLQKIPGDKGKISASTVRKAIADDDLETAREIMAGGQQEQDVIIKKLKDSSEDVTKREEILNSEEYFHIEDYDVRKEIVNEIEEDFGINQIEAMDMLLDILERK